MSDEAPADPVADRRPPRLTDELRARARNSPGSWIYALEHGYDADGAVPPHAVIGAWPVDEHGEPGTFTFNPGHRPSPQPKVLVDSADPVAAAVREALEGQSGHTTLLETLGDAIVYLPADAEGELVAYQDDDGGTYVEAATAPRHAPPAAPRLLPVRLHELVVLLPDDTDLRIYVDSDLSLSVPGRELRAALAADARSPAVFPTPSGLAPPTTVPGIPVKGRRPGAG
jgi:hypothetical protein